MTLEVDKSNLQKHVVEITALLDERSKQLEEKNNIIFEKNEREMAELRLNLSCEKSRKILESF